MTSDSDNKQGGKPVGNNGSDDFDEFDDFDDFDDFDEAAGLDQFGDEDDPFADDGEIDDDLDEAVAELEAEVDAMADDDEPAAEPHMDDDFDDISDEIADDMNAPAPVEPEAAGSAEAGADDDFEADDFAVDDFRAETNAADDEADDFETDDFDADDFEPPAPVAPEVEAVHVQPEDAAADDDFDVDADEFGAAETTPEDAFDAEPAVDEAIEQPAEDAAPVPPAPPSANNDLDAMLSASSSRTDGFDDFEEPVAAETTDVPGGHESDVQSDMAASEEMTGFDDDADDDLMPSGEAVAGLGDDEAVSLSETVQEPAAQMPVDPEPAPEPVMGEEPAGDDDTEIAAAAVAGAAAGAAAEAVMVDDAVSDFDDDEEEVAPPPPPPKKRKKHRGPGVPLIDIGEGGFHKLAEAYPKRLRAVHDLAVRKLTEKGLKIVDGACKKWADKASVPYRLEIDGVSNALNGDPGTYVINLAFEMACTTGAVEDAEGGSRLLHTLDWKLDGLGRLAVAARRHAPAGMWVNVTWPGYVGCLQGVAPGRFAAAINHAPINGKGPGYLAWPMSKLKWWGQKGVPPGLLLRKVFDECEDFDAAVEMIEKTPIAYPAIFSVLGTQEGEFSVIERTENSKSTQKRAPAVTNHWLNNEFGGTVMAYQSSERLVAMKSRINKGIDADEWLVHPILNPETRLAVDLNPTTGRMRIRGYQGLQPTTSLLDIYAD